MPQKRTLETIWLTLFVVFLALTTTAGQSSNVPPVDTGIVEGDTLLGRRTSTSPKENSPGDENRNNLVWTPGPAAPPGDRVPQDDTDFSSYAFPVMPEKMEKLGKLEDEPEPDASASGKGGEEGSGKDSSTVTNLFPFNPEEVATTATETKDVLGNDTDEWVEVEVNVNSTKLHITTPITNETANEASSVTTTTTTISTTALTTTTSPTDAPTDATNLETQDDQTSPSSATVITNNDEIPPVVHEVEVNLTMVENDTLTTSSSPTSATTTVPKPRTRPHRPHPPRRLTTSPALEPEQEPSSSPMTTDVTVPHMYTLPVEESSEEGLEDEATLSPHADVGSIPPSATNAIIISSVIGGCAVIFFAVLMGFCMWRQRTRTPRRPIYRPPDLGGTGGLTAIGGPLPALQLQNPKCPL